MPKNQTKSKSIMDKIKNIFKCIVKKPDFMTKQDYIICGILTLIFTVMVFFRLGNTYAPETSYLTTQEQHDIIIDFGDYILVEKLHVYLGHEANRNLSLSAYNEVTKEWMPIKSDANVGSVFQWNDVDVYYTLRYLGIVATDGDASFNEFVFTGPDGVITPVNTDAYPELFDEQDKFYTTKEHTYMDGTMFDEVYHGRTGYEFVHGLPTYETTHPQLGKCFIALGIKIFGMTPFGMRFMVAIFGILFVPLMYIFAKYMFKDTFVATFVGMLITFDCMHFTLSRIATIDIIVAFFIVAAYYYMYKYITEDKVYRSTIVKGTYAWYKDSFIPDELTAILVMAGLTMGMAIATKLTGVYAAVGLAVIFLYHTIKNWPRQQAVKMFWFCVAFFIAIPLVLYTLAYIPTVELYAQLGSTDKSISWGENGLQIGYGYTGLIARTLRNTNYMINYHKNLVATHYYSSFFYQWPIMWKPLLAANDYVSDGIVSAVSYIGNPAIWWCGIPCVLYMIYRAIFAKDKTARFLIVSYLTQYIPWMSISRITFIYHYLPSALFTMMIMGYCIKLLLDKFPKCIKGVKMYLAIVVILFLLFYPVISGYPISREWGLHLKWLPMWTIVL